jgi:hypothetical protein
MEELEMMNEKYHATPEVSRNQVCDQPKRDPDVTASINQLRHVVGDMRDVFEALSQRLVPVTRQEPATDTKEGIPRREGICELSNAIIEVTMHVNQTTIRIREQLDKLEI